MSNTNIDNNKILNMVETKAGLCTGGLHLERKGRARVYRARTESISLKPKRQKTCMVGFSFFLYFVYTHVFVMCGICMSSYGVCTCVCVCVEASG